MGFRSVVLSILLLCFSVPSFGVLTDAQKCERLLAVLAQTVQFSTESAQTERGKIQEFEAHLARRKAEFEQYKKSARLSTRIA